MKPGVKGLFKKMGAAILATPTYARQSEAFRTIFMHATLRRLLNLFVVETELRLRRVRVYGKPYVLVVDPTNVCNLRCPLCPTGIHTRGRKGMMMPFATYKRVIDEMAPTAFKVNLFNWGEALLNKHIFEMISYAKSKGLGTTMSTNLSVDLSDDQIDALLTSGIEFLFFSVDGATQEVYEIYRRKGNLDLVLRNMRRLVKRRGELGQSLPVLEWQFIPMRQNEHQIEEARRLAKEIGCDRFRCIPVGLPFDAEDPERLKSEWYPRFSDMNVWTEGEAGEPASGACYFLYRYLVVNPDAKVSPCCVVYGEKNDFGSLNSACGVNDIWNNNNYLSARALFKRGGHVGVETVCESCNLFKKHSDRSEGQRSPMP